MNVTVTAVGREASKPQRWWKGVPCVSLDGANLGPKTELTGGRGCRVGTGKRTAVYTKCLWVAPGGAGAFTVFPVKFSHVYPYILLVREYGRI